MPAWVRYWLIWGVILFLVYQGVRAFTEQPITLATLALDFVGWVGGTLLLGLVVQWVKRLLRKGRPRA
ncbi:MAG: hypothetical protein ACFBQW_07485 [Sphingomonadaceae bacterium]